MILGIMQPYFFPYLGYFDLINCSDHWIVFDPVQYIRHGWINRNRILHPSKGWQYFIVPLRRHSRDTLISDIVINDDIQWRKKIKGQLQHYEKKAPYFRQTMDLVNDCLSVEENSIGRMNTEVLSRVCEYLGIYFNYRFYGDLGLELNHIKAPGDWSLEISTALGAKEYVNSAGGEAIFDPSRFEERGIQLSFRSFPAMMYQPRGYDFEPNLSIIDVLMWFAPEDVKSYLDARSSDQASSES